jgi:carboxyl-terminal processing protease
LDFTLERQRIEVTNISYAGLIGENEETGYIRLSQFGNNSAEEVRESMIQLTESADLNGLVLDLRDNPGGILQEAVSIIDKFIEPCITVVDIRGRVAEYNQTFATREPVMFEKPVVVLMNGGSASASEVVAGALQDLDQALIVGEQSFGKGLVQIVKPLPYNTSLKITISRYYIPSGRSIQAVQYTHQGRNDVVMNTDSNKTEFKTRNGRIVYEGRGIEPDIVEGEEDLSIVEIALLQQGVYFDFATEFEAQNPSFEYTELPDDVFDEFRVFLREREFTFKTDSEKLLAELSTELESVDGAQRQLDTLNETIEREKTTLFEENESDIRRSLFLEIISRYQGESGSVKAGLSSDPEVLKALEFIYNTSELNKMLAGE